MKPLHLDAFETITLTDLAPMIDGKPDVTKIAEITLTDLGKRYRWQKVIFESALEVYDQMKPEWKGNKEHLLAQVVRIVEEFLGSNKIKIFPPIFWQHDDKKRILLTLNMKDLVQHIWEAIRFYNTLSLVPIFDTEKPIKSTADMRPWYTGKPCELSRKSHVNFCVFDSTWEASESFELDRNENVAAWVKNDHLGFEINYLWEGQTKKYRPDFLIKLADGCILVLEVKGLDNQQNKTKRAFLDEWVRAVNAHGGFGIWRCAVSRHPKDVHTVLK